MLRNVDSVLYGRSPFYDHKRICNIEFCLRITFFPFDTRNFESKIFFQLSFKFQIMLWHFLLENTSNIILNQNKFHVFVLSSSLNKSNWDSFYKLPHALLWDDTLTDLSTRLYVSDITAVLHIDFGSDRVYPVFRVELLRILDYNNHMTLSLSLFFYSDDLVYIPCFATQLINTIRALLRRSTSHFACKQPECDCSIFI